MKIIKKYKSTILTGKGFLQGTGFDITVSVVEIFNFKFITGIFVDTESEWAKNLKSRLEKIS